MSVVRLGSNQGFNSLEEAITSLRNDGYVEDGIFWKKNDYYQMIAISRLSDEYYLKLKKIQENSLVPLTIPFQITYRVVFVEFIED